MRKSLGTLAITGLVVACAGCSGSSSTAGPAGSAGGSTSASGTATAAAPITAATTQPAAPASVPAGFRLISGTAYQFALPTALKFTVDKPVVSSDGALAGRWRYQVSPSGPFCVVVAAEQAKFANPFPASVIQAFTAEGQPDQKTLVNQAMTPAPADTIGGVEEESTFTGTLTSGKTFASRLYQRVYLTAGKTLITLTAAGPEVGADRCRLAEIVKTFSATGQEFTGVTQVSPSAS